MVLNSLSFLLLFYCYQNINLKITATRKIMISQKTFFLVKKGLLKVINYS